MIYNVNIERLDPSLGGGTVKVTRFLAIQATSMAEAEGKAKMSNPEARITKIEESYLDEIIP